MKVVVLLNKKKEGAVAQKDKDVDEKEGCGNPVVNCLQAWKTSQQKGTGTTIGPHVGSIQKSCPFFSIITTEMKLHFQDITPIVSSQNSLLKVIMTLV